MKKKIRIFLIIIGILISIILVDTLQARIFKNSPIISWKEELADADSWVDKGILLDTYYCTKDTDIVTVSWHFKNSKYTCPIDNISEKETISMTIKEGTLTKTGATIVITDLSGNDNTYEEWYKIEKEENGKWYDVETIINNYAFNDLGYKVNENNEVNLVINWEWLYGELETGEYRLVKSINNEYISVEFQINEIVTDDSDNLVIDDNNPTNSNETTPTTENSSSTISGDDTDKVANDNTFIIKTIVDKTKPNTSCAQAIDVFYEDTNYKYYYTCLKSQNIIVEYTNGTEETIKEALKNSHIKITDLDKYNIHYLKTSKQVATK